MARLTARPSSDPDPDPDPDPGPAGQRRASRNARAWTGVDTGGERRIPAHHGAACCATPTPGDTGDHEEGTVAENRTGTTPATASTVAPGRPFVRVTPPAGTSSLLPSNATAHQAGRGPLHDGGHVPW